MSEEKAKVVFRKRNQTSVSARQPLRKIQEDDDDGVDESETKVKLLIFLKKRSYYSLSLELLQRK